MLPLDTAHERLIIGLGETGISCARHFSRRKLPFVLLDTRLDPPYLSAYTQEFPHAPLYLGPFEPHWFQQIKELIISPGISLSEPVIADALARANIRPVGDIELFAREARAPIIAITGTNAKGTVTTLVGDMIHAAQRTVEVGGNIGKVALDLLTTHTPDFYVLEISSFQLETTYSLQAKIATVLNISPDHLDRHQTLDHYTQAKQRIYHQCDVAIWNRNDPSTYPHAQGLEPKKILSFGLEKTFPPTSEFGLQQLHNTLYLTYGTQCLMPVNRLHIKGQHNWINVLAALTIGHAVNLPITAMLSALCQFTGLPHRCQWITEQQGIAWYNDSKATNIGATLAALAGLGPTIPGKIVLIAGGLGKAADFNLLSASVARYVKTAILLGQDAPLLKKALEKSTVTQSASDLSHAVLLARQVALPGDTVLLSPACASLDMFKNYEERGDLFMQQVRAAHGQN